MQTNIINPTFLFQPANSALPILHVQIRPPGWKVVSPVRQCTRIEFLLMFLQALFSASQYINDKHHSHPSTIFITYVNHFPICSTNLSMAGDKISSWRNLSITISANLTLYNWLIVNINITIRRGKKVTINGKEVLQ